MALEIPIEGEAPNDPTPTDPYRELFIRALESPRGIAIECADFHQAVAKRAQLYSKRAAWRAAGFTGFDNLTITLFDNEVHITPEAEAIVRDL